MNTIEKDINDPLVAIQKLLIDKMAEKILEVVIGVIDQTPISSKMKTLVLLSLACQIKALEEKAVELAKARDNN